MAESTTSNLQDLVCEYVKKLVPYESARRLFSGGQYWLNANESPFSHSYGVDSERFNRYPECQPEELITGYANYTGISADKVLVSRGADEGIELLIRAFCLPGQDSVLICPPTYGMYAISAETFNINVEKAPLLADFSLDLEALKQVANSDNIPKLVFLCSPNNPTGTLLSEQQITEVLALFAGKSLVVLDEAYIEFSWRDNWATKLNEYPQLVILRTLSKAFGLAGLRCGFTLASEEIIKTLLKVIAPYPISNPVAQIAAQALSDNGLRQMQKDVQLIQTEQASLKDTLSQIKAFELVGDDKANFLLFRTAEKQAMMDYLVSNGMLIRDQSKQLHLDNCLRVSIGNAEENQQLLKLITSFLQRENNQ